MKYPSVFRGVLGSLVLSLTGLAACNMSNTTGNLSSSLKGDTTHTATQGSPTDALRAACGAGAPTAAGSVIVRQPYLQQVTTISAVVGWVSSAPDGERVDVTLPDGSPVATAPAALDAAAQKAEGAN